MKDYSIVRFKNDSTTVFPCKDNDVFIWIKEISGIWSSETKYDIADFWQMKEGDQIILTNRLDDVPPAFQLHPTKVGGRSNINKMIHKLNAGYSPDATDVDLNGLSQVWQLNIGDYMIRSGVSRPDAINDSSILGIFEFETGSMACIHNYEYAVDTKNITQIPPEHLQMIRDAFEFVNRKTIKRVRADEWKLG